MRSIRNLQWTLHPFIEKCVIAPASFARNWFVENQHETISIYAIKPCDHRTMALRRRRILQSAIEFIVGRQLHKWNKCASVKLMQLPRCEQYAIYYPQWTTDFESESEKNREFEKSTQALLANIRQCINRLIFSSSTRALNFPIPTHNNRLTNTHASIQCTTYTIH